MTLLYLWGLFWEFVSICSEVSAKVPDKLASHGVLGISLLFYFRTEKIIGQCPSEKNLRNETFLKD